MNKVMLMGRLTRDPETKYTQGSQPMAITRYTLAVNRRMQKDGQQQADFISCVAFGKPAEFAEKYLHKGMKIAVEGRIQTGSYTRQDGQKVFTTDVVVESHEFCESKQGGTAAAPVPNGAVAQTQPAAQAKPAPAPRQVAPADGEWHPMTDDFGFGLGIPA